MTHWPQLLFIVFVISLNLRTENRSNMLIHANAVAVWYKAFYGRRVAKTSNQSV